jgi:hypothetical protein
VEYKLLILRFLSKIVARFRRLLTIRAEEEGFNKG